MLPTPSRSSRLATLVAATLAAALSACASGDAPDLRGITPRGDGPRVRFDVSARPLPLIPLPNDVATFPDPTSRTGRRLNATLAGSSSLERDARAGFSELEGWGTTAPITVQFERPPGLPSEEAAIDLAAFAARHRGYDLRDDAVYLVDLETGTPALLDVEHGHFPTTVADPAAYGPNDPRAREQNLLFETVDETGGVPGRRYDPALDTDFDGVLDRPNGKPWGLVDGGIRGIDDVLTWYERETDTLVLKPTLPLAEKREYAVVLTDRVVDVFGRPARSPFPRVYHALQRSAAERLGAILADARLTRFFGDVAGTGFGRVAFAWTFTTGPQTEDLRLLRDGLAGRGRFGWLARDYPPAPELFPAVGAYANAEPPPGWESLPACAGQAERPFAMRFDRFAPAARTLVERVFGFQGPALEAMLESLANVDHFVVGTFASPQLVGDPSVIDPASRFRVNFLDGTARVTPERVKFWIAVPKETAKARQPFPVALWNHGTGLFAEELLFHAGAMAQQGVATAAIDMPGHGLPLDATTSNLARAVLAEACLAPLVRALEATRARDLNGDGVKDSGQDLWSSHAFHTRDMLRQSVVDELQFLRVLRSFDGRALAPAPYVRGAPSSLLGDFDGDGVVDVQGPSAPHAIAGQSFGGLVTQIVGALDPNVKVTVPISGAGGIGEVAARSYGVVEPVLGKLLTPIVVTVPAAERAGASGDRATRCTPAQRSLRFVVNDLVTAREVEIACLGDDRGPRGAAFVLRNGANGEVRCARSDAEGRVRVPIAASPGDPLSIDVFAGAAPLVSYGTCKAAPGAKPLATLSKWEVAAVRLREHAGAVPSCADPDGCQQFRGVLYGVGSALVAPQEGLGLRRQTPEFRRLTNLTQHAVDAADPVNYASYYFIRTMNGPDGRPMAPRALLNVATLGDGYVNVGASVHFARAAGVVPFVPTTDAARQPEFLPWAVPSSLKMTWGKTPDEILVDRFVVEGLGRLERTPASAACGVNHASSAACGEAPMRSDSVCRATLYDPDFLDEGAGRYGQQSPATPLRLARDITQPITGDDDLVRAFRPRTQSKPLYTDAEGWPGGAPVAAHLGALVAPTGQHSWFAPNPCKAWDDVRYLENLVARFVATGGADLPYLTRPGSHPCLARGTCDFLRP
jgi:hypothetical protein